MFRKTCLAVFVASAVMASAQAGIAGAVGLGTATDANGAKGGFGLAFATRTLSDGSVRVGGSADFLQKVEGARPTEVKLGRADVVTVNGHAVHAEGRGGFSGVVNGTRVRASGRVVVDAVDNRARGATTGDPDTFAITFTSTDGATTYSFSGNVSRGDIAVGTH